MSPEPARILVADDEQGMREACRRVLVSEGYEVEVAQDGVAALELCEAGKPFAAALIDLKMPRMGGLELIERLRENDADTVLFVITAYASIDTAVEATKRGAYGYIPKPFTPAELLLPVKNGLERRSLAIEARRLREERESRLLEVAFERSKCNTIINCMTDGVLVVNHDGQIVLRNAAAARILPECADLPLPAPLSRLGRPELTDLVAETLGTEAAPGIVSREVPLGECTYMANVSSVAEPGGTSSGAVAVLRDITALKKLETAKSMFVSMVAHELKNPLAAIEGYLNVIVSGVAGEDPHRDRQMMQRALLRSRTLRTMVSDLLNLTAIETGNFTVKRTPLDITEVVADAVEASREKAEEKGLELTFDAKAEAPCPSTGSGHHEPAERCERVLADRDAMARVFANLIDNAIKYTPAPGHVAVRVENHGMYVKVVVQDDGIGMTPEEAGKVFDEFFRAKNPRAAQIPGTGLGLTLVKQLVAMHHGRIAVHTVPGEGSSFAVSLPTADQAGGPS